MRAATAFGCALLLLASPALAAQYHLRVVARLGSPSPIGGSFDRFSAEPVPVIAPVNGHGEVAFFALLARSAASEGIFLATGGRTVRIAAAGDSIPGAGTITGFGKEPAPALDGGGNVGFHASLSGGRSLEGVFVAAAGRPPRVIALAGEAAPGVPTGSIASLDAPVINDRGDVAFLAVLQRGRDSLQAIFGTAGGHLRKIAAQGDRTPAGGVYAGFGPPSLNNRGAVAFGAVVEGGAAVGGLFLVDAAGQGRKLLLAGDDSPLGMIARFGERVALNDAGQVAFHGVINNDASPAGIFVVSGSGARLVAHIGETAPGGGRFANFGPWPALSPDGEIAFVASLDGGATPLALFLADGTGLQRVAAAGDPSPVGRIASFGLYPTASISRRHTIAFTVASTAGTLGAEAILVAEPAP